MSDKMKKFLSNVYVGHGLAFMPTKKYQIYNEVWDMEIQGGVRRHTTERILLMVEDGLLDRDTVIMACLKYMSEDEVADMARANEFFHDEEDEADEGDEDEPIT